MMLPYFDNFAQAAVARILNSLPEGILIAVFTWLMLRLIPRQNSRTRFAVWFVALLAVAGLPFLGASGQVAASFRHSPVIGGTPLVTLPAHWALALFVAWILAACAALMRLTFGIWRLRHLRESCAGIHLADLDPSVRQLVTEFSSSRSVTIATSSELSVPAALGFLKPMIVIPAWALQELSPEQLRVVLLHEFAHLKRWDDWTNLLQKVVRAAFLFHPAIWWIEKQLSLEREMACDDHVLAETANPRGYARCLIALLERNLERNFARKAWRMTQAVVQRTCEATRRLSQILDANRATTKEVWKPALGLVSAVSVLCLMIVPVAPRLVAFVPSAAGARPFAPSLARTQMQPAVVIPAVVIPAAAHLEPRPLRKAHAPSLAQSERRQAAHRNMSPRVVEANPQPARLEAEIVKAAASDPAISVVETVVVIRTVKQIGPNSWEWSVRMCRVTLVPGGERMLPPPKTT